MAQILHGGTDLAYMQEPCQYADFVPRSPRLRGAGAYDIIRDCVKFSDNGDGMKYARKSDANDYHSRWLTWAL